MSCLKNLQDYSVDVNFLNISYFLRVSNRRFLTITWPLEAFCGYCVDNGLG